MDSTGNREPKHGFKTLAHMTHERNVVVINETHLLITDHEYHIYKPQSHSALKLEKKCNFKSTKTHFLPFQK